MSEETKLQNELKTMPEETKPHKPTKMVDEAKQRNKSKKKSEKKKRRYKPITKPSETTQKNEKADMSEVAKKLNELPQKEPILKSNRSDGRVPSDEFHKVRFQSVEDDPEAQTSGIAENNNGVKTDHPRPILNAEHRIADKRQKLYNAVGKPLAKLAKCSCVNTGMVVNFCICILFCLVIASALSTILTFRCFQDVADLKRQNENLTSVVDTLKTENGYLKSLILEYKNGSRRVDET